MAGGMAKWRLGSLALIQRTEDLEFRRPKTDLYRSQMCL